MNLSQPQTQPLLELRALSSEQIGPLALSLDSGELVTISGPSGAGKSLLLRAICDLDEHHGQVLLAGRERITYPPSQWRRKVAYLPADPAWWEDSVGPHLGDTSDSLLKGLGFTPEVREWTVERLSSGERQRLALARLLGNQPQVLLLDEPTANLDLANAERIEALVKSYLQEHQAAALWVSHDAEQLRRLQARTLHIVDGKLLASEVAESA
ncbi:ABC-type iron transport system FetAB, ATPase component [Ectothiorhodosinus mongolicus]|uniref:ABC-type iron transport system FetAB, ATPase component n=1 Tax=Ectothiorhodosinus mongolicus TaxID=233100 RepID=A0A1R3VY96_9GAMM|nr:ATP-binding cassette domain-containing protein [Ectothiorhodosinus mongolicus]ULX57114.1 ATP-binding protein [Ectothiorhodosinus mongolicus]SIT69993.1 ABC-type iron transport system FetAB, ATPase component [Ectothiorhodosinus mongolicus]